MSHLYPSAMPITIYASPAYLIWTAACDYSLYVVQIAIALPSLSGDIMVCSYTQTNFGSDTFWIIAVFNPTGICRLHKTCWFNSKCCRILRKTHKWHFMFRKTPHLPHSWRSWTSSSRFHLWNLSSQSLSYSGALWIVTICSTPPPLASSISTPQRSRS